MEYRKLKKESMPPVDNRASFILWMDARETDGGFPALAKRVQYDLKPPYIRYITPDGWRVLKREEYKNCLWTEIETPAQITARMERREKRQREREKRKACSPRKSA